MKKTILLSLLFVYQLIGIYAQTILTDLRPGMDGSEPDFELAVQKDDYLYFIANPDGVTPRLYKTDGTTGNTIFIEGGDNLFVSMILGFLGDDLLYIAGDILHGGQLALYKTNGNPGEGQFIIDYNQNNDWFIAYPMHIVKDGVFYFYGAEANTGFELWRTDGTASGTYLVKDINPGVGSSLIITQETQYFAEYNGYIYFGAAEPVNGAELWRTDGTEAGTMMVSNIDTSVPQHANMGSNPAYFCVYNNSLYFSAYRPVDGRELWKTNGTDAGTVLVKDLSAGDGNPSHMIEHNGFFYFTAYYPNQNYTLYKSDGTTNGTVAVKQPDNGGPTISLNNPYVKFKGKLYFEGSDDQGLYHIWYTDGTVGGTNFLPNGPSPFYSTPLNLLATTNYLYFTSNISSTDYKNGVYRTTDIPNQVNLLTNSTFNANEFNSIFMVNNCLLVRGDDETVGEEIYTICNQNTEPLGLNELMESPNTLIAHPNPCVDKVMITSEFDVTNIKHIELHSVSGITMGLAFSKINQTTISIDGLSGFSAGVYFLSVEMDNGQKQQIKLMIQ